MIVSMKQNALRERKSKASDLVNSKLPAIGTEKARHPSQSEASSGSSPSFNTAFLLIAIVRIVGACVTGIADCDEVFNFWEPVHYLLYGLGLQTWEYSPAYALRSYAFVGEHALIAALIRPILGQDKVMLFYAVRIVLGIKSAFCEAMLYSSVQQLFPDTETHWFFLLFNVSSAGMFAAASALLPNSFCMYFVMLSYCFWFHSEVIARGIAKASSEYQTQQMLAIVLGLVACVFGWPYVGLIFVPLGLGALRPVGRGGLGFFRALGLASGATILMLSVSCFIDNLYYRKPLLPVFNHVGYNIFGGSSGKSGSDLYGTEPWTYYFANLTLNCNIAFALALIYPLVSLLVPTWDTSLRTFPYVNKAVTVTAPAASSGLASFVQFGAIDMLLQGFWSPALCFVGSLYGWFGLMTLQAHKEERFMTVIYPLVSLAAALCLATLAKFVRHLVSNSAVCRVLSRAMVLSCIAVSVVMSVSRIAALHRNFGGVMRLHSNLYYDIQQQRGSAGLAAQTHAETTVCVGGEWFRFPSHFFLPSNTKLAFIPSSFKGILPRHYGPLPSGTWLTPPHMNDMNREETERYVSLDTCDYFVYSDMGQDDTELERNGMNLGDGWTVLRSEPLLDPSRSSSLRAFYVPGQASGLIFGEYRVLQRNR